MATVIGASIESLKADVLEMMVQAKIAISESVLSLDDRDTDRAQCVIHQDQRIDTMEREIEKKCLELLEGRIGGKALRTVAATYKIIGDVERIGDYGVAIARVTLNVANKPVMSNALGIIRMSEITSGMLQACIDSYGGKSSLDMDRVFKDDDEVDRLYNDIFVNSFTSILHEPKIITNVFYTVTAGRAMERIGDHITDIAERIHFIDTGEIIRRKEPVNIPDFP
jgi:phosphate transport system protein